MTTQGFDGPSTDDFGFFWSVPVQFLLGALWVALIGGLAAIWIGAFVSISRRSTLMSGLEMLGWYAFVAFAQIIGPLVWFLYARNRYALPTTTRSSPTQLASPAIRSTSSKQTSKRGSPPPE